MAVRFYRWWRWCFNPLPSPKRGETRYCSIIRRAQPRFNPLPSPKRGETASFVPVWDNIPFQSAPLTEARGDHLSPGTSYHSTSVSIRSPHRSEGRLYRRNCRTRDREVSIRSPHRSEGRQSRAAKKTQPAKFQSAPLTEARGDRDEQRDEDEEDVSIRSPHRSEGRPTTSPIQSTGVIRFNPLPSPKRGETFIAGVDRKMRDRFQSAPLTEARGDLSAAKMSEAANLFQSAPLTEARGDAGCCNQRNTKGLHRWMRDSIEWMTRIPDSSIDERANLLLYIRFRIARNQGRNSITLPSRIL